MTVATTANQTALEPIGRVRSGMEHVEDAMRWCNHMYLATCPFNAKAGGEAVCKFLHMDDFLQRAEACGGVRGMGCVPNLMEKNMKTLMRDLGRILAARVKSNATPGRERTESFKEVADAFRALGWHIPEEPVGRRTQRNHAPLGRSIHAITTLIARSLHYDFSGSPDIMLATIAYVMSIDTTSQRQARVSPGSGEQCSSPAAPSCSSSTNDSDCITESDAGGASDDDTCVKRNVSHGSNHSDASGDTSETWRKYSNNRETYRFNPYNE